ncbi:hypothetical protein GWK47_012603 [Chionoecetes opilio]|uniref:Uncharacterized protein n=1 Tax=Chionoecetes opilio TaxID=41210 RepID=A0A8J4XWX8_CHIOP|nr:hypothetical protein GWK47_012603 [Chionoecetes opilio]
MKLQQPFMVHSRRSQDVEAGGSDFSTQNSLPLWTAQIVDWHSRSCSTVQDFNLACLNHRRRSIPSGKGALARRGTRGGRGGGLERPPVGLYESAFEAHLASILPKHHLGVEVERTTSHGPLFCLPPLWRRRASPLSPENTPIPPHLCLPEEPRSAPPLIIMNIPGLKSCPEVVVQVFTVGAAVSRVHWGNAGGTAVHGAAKSGFLGVLACCLAVGIPRTQWVWGRDVLDPLWAPHLLSAALPPIPPLVDYLWDPCKSPREMSHVKATGPHSLSPPGPKSSPKPPWDPVVPISPHVPFSPPGTHPSPISPWGPRFP